MPSSNGLFRSIFMSRTAASLLALSLLASFTEPAATLGDEASMSADQALDLAKKTGRPVFAVAGSET
jgi:hypothetical protein